MQALDMWGHTPIFLVLGFLLLFGGIALATRWLIRDQKPSTKSKMNHRGFLPTRTKGSNRGHGKVVPLPVKPGSRQKELEKYAAALHCIFQPDSYKIVTTPSLIDIVKMDPALSPGTPVYEHAYARLSSSHTSFAVYKLNGNLSDLIGCIDLIPDSVDQPSRLKRDIYVENALRGSSVPFYKQIIRPQYSVKNVAEELRKAFDLDRIDSEERVGGA